MIYRTELKSTYFWLQIVQAGDISNLRIKQELPSVKIGGFYAQKESSIRGSYPYAIYNQFKATKVPEGQLLAFFLA